MANVFYENDKAISPHILNLQEVLTLLCVCQRVPSCLFVSSKEQNPLNILLETPVGHVLVIKIRHIKK